MTELSHGRTSILQAQIQSILLFPSEPEVNLLKSPVQRSVSQHHRLNNPVILTLSGVLHQKQHFISMSKPAFHDRDLIGMIARSHV